MNSRFSSSISRSAKVATAISLASCLAFSTVGFTTLTAAAADGEASTPAQQVATRTVTADGASITFPAQLSSTTRQMKITGSGWFDKSGKGGSTLLVKLHLSTAGSDFDRIYHRTGTEILDHPVNHAPDNTIWLLIKAKNDGTFDQDIDLPQADNVPSDLHFKAGLVAGQRFDIDISSGLADPVNDVARSVETGAIPIDGVPWLDPATNNPIKCHSTVEKRKFTVSPEPDSDGFLKVHGEGLCHPVYGGSRIAFKIDNGLYQHAEGFEAYADNNTVWAIRDADPHTGVLDTTIHIPDGTDKGEWGSVPRFSNGQHKLRILIGSLKKGDRTFSQDYPFIVGPYRPNDFLDPIDYHKLTDATKRNITVRDVDGQLRISLPGTRIDDWIQASVYLPDTSPRWPWGKLWSQVGLDGTIRLKKSDQPLPKGSVKLVLQSGNQKSYGKILGWTPIDSSVLTSNINDKPEAPATSTPAPDPEQVIEQEYAQRNRDQFPDAVVDGVTAVSDLLAKTLSTLAVVDAVFGHQATSHAGKSTTAATTTAHPTPKAERHHSATEPEKTRTVVKVIRRTERVMVPTTPRHNPGPKPTSNPKLPATVTQELTPQRMGFVTSAKKGSILTLAVGNREPGDWVFLYTYTPTPKPVGWAQLDNHRQVSLNIAGFKDGLNKVALVDRKQHLLGWAPVQIGASSTATAGTAESAATVTHHSGTSTRPTITATEGVPVSPHQSTRAQIERTAASSSSALLSWSDWLLILLAIVIVAAAGLVVWLRTRARPQGKSSAR